MVHSHRSKTAERPHKRSARNEARLGGLLIDFLADHLADISRVFGGDLQQALILVVLGRMHPVAVVGSRRRDVHPPPPMTASQLAETTAIPRQTVRRKLLAMKALGWLEQDDQQAWRLVMSGRRSAASVALHALDARGVHRAMRLAGAFQNAA